MWNSFGFEFINFYFIPGLVLGCIYALGAIGITLTFSILRFANFAHGETMMTGAYLTWTVMAICSGVLGFAVHPLVAAVPATLLVVLLFWLQIVIFTNHLGRPIQSKWLWPVLA